MYGQSNSKTQAIIAGFIDELKFSAMFCVLACLAIALWYTLGCN